MCPSSVLWYGKIALTNKIGHAFRLGLGRLVMILFGQNQKDLLINFCIRPNYKI
jgi:hypothetical protein